MPGPARQLEKRGGEDLVPAMASSRSGSARDLGRKLIEIADATHFPHLRLHVDTETRFMRGAIEHESYDLLARYERNLDGGEEPDRWAVAMRKHRERSDDERVLLRQKLHGGEARFVEGYYWTARWEGIETGRPWPFDAWHYVGRTGMVLFDTVLPVYDEIKVKVHDGSITGVGAPPENSESLQVDFKVSPGNVADRFFLRIWFHEHDNYELRVEEFIDDKIARVIVADGWFKVSYAALASQAGATNQAWLPSQRTYTDLASGRTTIATTRRYDIRPFPDSWVSRERLGKKFWW